MAIAPFITQNHGGHIGQSSPRSDGRVKVRGEARYAAEFNPEGVLYGFPVSTTVPTGQIMAIETGAAERVPGVVAVITHANAPEQAPMVAGTEAFFVRLMGSKPVLDRDRVLSHNQFVALVVADTYETARSAAALVTVEVAEAGSISDFDTALESAYKPEVINDLSPADTDEGDVEAALATATVVVDATYDTPFEHPNAMEPHGAVAEWRDGEVFIQDSSQSISIVAASVAVTLNLMPEQVHVESRFVGGGFGSKWGVRPQVMLAALAAKVTDRPVKVAMTRQQNFSNSGQRTMTRQRVRLGAGPDGRLVAISHDCYSQTSVYDEFVEQTGAMTRIMYASPNRLIHHRVARMSTPTPAPMRAPGETPGSFALESAMDELAVTLGMDPIELRIVNEPDQDPDTGLPWSSRSVIECLRQGAERFGWERRNPDPGQVRDGRWLVGMGVGCATYPAISLPTSARATLRGDGTGLVALAASDIGTGAHTVLRQIAAEALGLIEEQVQVDIGDSDLPMTLGAGGSAGTASWGSAVVEVIAELRQQLADLARDDEQSPLVGLPAEDIILADGYIGPSEDVHSGEPLAAFMARNAPDGLTVNYDYQPTQQPEHSTHSFGAQFAEVGVDVDTGEVRVRRMLGAFGVGRVINPMTARSQLVGGIIMGVGQALMEETHLDPRWGQWVNRDLAEYHVPVSADIPEIDAFWVEEEDRFVNVLGTKAVGEIPIVGVAAAIANAVYNATGVRVRDLPITLDKVLAGLPPQS